MTTDSNNSPIQENSALLMLQQKVTPTTFQQAVTNALESGKISPITLLAFIKAIEQGNKKVKEELEKAVIKEVRAHGKNYTGLESFGATVEIKERKSYEYNPDPVLDLYLRMSELVKTLQDNIGEKIKQRQNFHNSIKGQTTIVFEEEVVASLIKDVMSLVEGNEEQQSFVNCFLDLVNTVPEVGEVVTIYNPSIKISDVISYTWKEKK